MVVSFFIVAYLGKYLPELLTNFYKLFDLF
jgi:hypothetical protein